ncbi:hypothetical protein [Thiofilum flexile]|uniref:hypothetical protein n=1 Tax=Thiofilum flexile TaxID=125627 RepID=UPI00036CFF9A|nr:hypothetical protein [Thiofilum flexile]
MSEEIRKLEQQAQQLQAKIKAKKEAELLAKRQALGAGIMAAVKADLLSWESLRPALQKTIKSKKERELLGLDRVDKKSESPSSYSDPLVIADK